MICCNPLSPSPLQEIPLSEILQVENSRDYSSLAQGSNPHCFEIISATMVYYVGENNGSHYHSPALAASGVGMEVAQGWEKAIRQALMPVTPQPSVASAAGLGKDHSKFDIQTALKCKNTDVVVEMESMTYKYEGIWKLIWKYIFFESRLIVHILL